MKISELKECEIAAKCEHDINCSHCNRVIGAGTSFCLSRYVRETFHEHKFYRTEYFCPDCFVEYRDMQLADIPGYIYALSIPDDYISYSRIR